MGFEHFYLLYIRYSSEIWACYLSHVDDRGNVMFLSICKFLKCVSLKLYSQISALKQET